MLPEIYFLGLGPCFEILTMILAETNLKTVKAYRSWSESFPFAIVIASIFNLEIIWINLLRMLAHVAQASENAKSILLLEFSTRCPME